MEKPIVDREEIVSFLFHAYSLERIQLGRDAYAKWRRLYEGTEYDPPYSPANRLTIGLLDMLTTRENVLRRLEQQGKNTTAFMDKLQARAGRHTIELLSGAYPDETDELTKQFAVEIAEEKQRLAAIEERIRRFMNETS